MNEWVSPSPCTECSGIWAHYRACRLMYGLGASGEQVSAPQSDATYANAAQGDRRVRLFTLE